MTDYSHLIQAELIALLHRKDTELEHELAAHALTKRQLAEKTAESSPNNLQLTSLPRHRNESAMRPSPRILALKNDRDLQHSRAVMYKKEVDRLTSVNEELESRVQMVGRNSTLNVNMSGENSSVNLSFGGTVHHHTHHQIHYEGMAPGAGACAAQEQTDDVGGSVMGGNDLDFTAEEVE